MVIKVGQLLDHRGDIMIVEDFDNLKRITASYGYILKDKYGQPLGSSVTVRADQVDNFYEEKVIVTDVDKLDGGLSL